MSAGNPFDSFFGSAPSAPAKAPAEKGCPVRGRVVDGDYYVRLDDVVELLNLNGVLPKAAARFGTFLERRDPAGS